MKAEMSGKICSFKSIEIDGDSGKVREGDRHSILLRFHMPRVELHPLDNLNKQDWHPGQGGKKHERKILTTGHNSQLAVVQTEIFSFENDTAVAPGLIWGFFRLAGPEQRKVRCIFFFRTKAS